MRAQERIVFALDVPSQELAESWIDRLRDHVGVFKVGLELFTAAGGPAVAAVRNADRDCFVDLKLHDIPATMAKAATVVADLGARFLTVHAAAGPRALEAVRRAVEGFSVEVLAVTVLTSMGEDELAAIGLAGPAEDAVVRLGKLAIDAGAHGLVCSPRECSALRATVGTATLMVPGVRPAEASTDDQTRVATPARAIADGADFLVIGRPIRNASDPVAAAQAIAAEIEAVA
ncbi:MAG: orotidine-5'-phosphate decarboxylase [Myxococcota bacterium]